MQVWVAIAALFGLIAVGVAAEAAGGWRFAAATAIGGLGGLALYHAAFGFTAAWRRFARERRGAGLRAQMALLAAASIVSFPLIGWGDAVGIQANGWVFPFGFTAALGALIFGVGMQLGGGCGSGTLFTVGGGSSRMMITLAAFIAGSVIWTITDDFWRDLRRFDRETFGAFSMIRTWGPVGALAASLSIFAAIWLGSAALERRRHGGLEPLRETASIFRGPWSLLLGAAALALVVILTFLTLGRPWGVTAAFPLWGVKILDGLGAPIGDWNGWSAQQIDRSVFAHSTSVMNFGVMLGALAAAGLAGRFAPTLRLSARDVATAIIGGLLMGYGARLAYGCNIGGFVGGVVSGSAHGWQWLAFGFLGSGIGVWLRGRLGMDTPLSPA